MYKVKKLFLFLSYILFNGISAECDSHQNKNILVDDGSLLNANQPEIKFEKAVFDSNTYLLENIKFNSCEGNSSWEISADEATLENEVLSIKNARVELFNTPIFWLGDIVLDKDKEINIPNLGITDSDFDFSYQFKAGNQSAQYVIEPILTKSQLGISFNAKLDDGKNKTEIQSFAINDEQSSWVFKVNSRLQLVRNLELSLDYGDFSGNSLIQNYGYKFLDINRRTLDLKKNIKLSWLINNRHVVIGQQSFENLNLPRPITHTKNYLKYESSYILDSWKIQRSTEISKFKIKNNTVLLNRILPPNEGADFPYFVHEDVERKNRKISFSNSSLGSAFSSKIDIAFYWKQYTINNTTNTSNISSESFQIKQTFDLDKKFLLGYIYSSFDDQDNIPLLDSYPKSPSPENNISMQSWYGDDRSANQRKIFLYYQNTFEGMEYSLSTNLYEKYNFSNINSELGKHFNKKPVFFAINKSFGNSKFSAIGNYSVKDNKISSSVFEITNKNSEREFSLSKREYLNSGFPLSELNNYVLKYSQNFNNITIFARTQYSISDENINENIFGAEWYKDCFKFRIAFERARFFPFIEPDYTKGNYFNQIYLTNPILKNNLSFEFELIGLTNSLKPINEIIQNGLFN